MSAWVVGWMLVLVAAQGSATDATRASASGTKPPNIIFIQAEAQGPGSISVDFDGQPPNTARPEGLTPNLEQLAKEGMRFSDFYASCPRCTPSRATWVTGISPAKLHMTYQSEGGASRGGDQKSRYRLMRMIPPEAAFELPPGVRTSGAMLHDLGYGTAHFGKWHAARQPPSQLGFDACDGANGNQGPDRGERPNPEQATAITDKGIAFMREQVKKGKPFFVQLSHYGFDGENAVSPESLAAARKLMPDVRGKPMGAVAGAREVDTQVGRVLAALKEMGVAGNTWIFYSADHGAQGGGGGSGRSQANPPFSGGKGSVSEGGIRVPFLVWGPGVKPGSVCRVRASGMDLLPTMMDLAGKPLPKPAAPDDVSAVEGGSLVPLLLHGGQGTVDRSHEELVIHFPHYDLNNGGPASAIYVDGWKMVRNYDSGRTTLYEIGKDPAERHDLADKQPDRVKEMTARLDAYLKAVKAAMPEKNTDPAAGTGDPYDMPQPDGRGGGGNKGGSKGGGGKGGKGTGRGN